MIKYVEYNRYDEYGEHITPIGNLDRMEKTASRKYSSAIINFIESLQKRPDKYYVVMNAMGSFEYWGANNNGDIFPEAALKHFSLPSDANSPEDYGYKTFEYYAKFYKHHVNKDPKNSFGDVLFSYWNPENHRVELVVAIDRFKSKDTVEALESGKDVGVSMGARVPYDICNICKAKIRKRSEDCKHLKHHLREIIDANLAAQWSRELGMKILPGAVVGMINETPRFFDISEVTVQADRAAFVLGKVANKGALTRSTDLASVVGVTDEDIDKVASIIKKSYMKKKIDPSEERSEGVMYSPKARAAARRILEEEALKQIQGEPDIPSNILDMIASSYGSDRCIGTIDSLGIPIRPKELQRIILVSEGRKDLADALERRGIFFDNLNYPGEFGPSPLPDVFDHRIDGILSNIVRLRSSVPHTFTPERRKLSVMIIKEAGMTKTSYDEYDQSLINQALPWLIGAASTYLGLKAYAKDRSIRDLVERSSKSHVIPSLAGGALIYNMINRPDMPDEFLIPAQHYEDVLMGTNFSGYIKTSSLKNTLTVAGRTLSKYAPEIKGGLKYGLGTSVAALPLAHLISSYNRSHIIQKGRPAGVAAHAVDPVNTPLALSTLGAGLGVLAGRGRRLAT